MREPRTQAVVAVLLAIVGFALVTQIRTTATDDEYAGYQEQDLVDVLTGLTGAAERAETEVGRLEQAREDLLTDSRSREAALEQARQEATDLAILAGTVPVTGPGLRITISDGSGRVGIDAVLDTVQELRTAFAEAIELNDRVRLVAQSALREVAGGIEVDGVVLEPPYVLEVIGEPATLRGALTFARGPMETIESAGGSVEVEVLDRVDIESVRPVEGPGYAPSEDSQ
jgi:uncharacterized protein YlxW (UPF0749 family)